MPAGENLSAQAVPAAGTVKPGPLPGWPQFDDDEIEAAAAVLRSGKVNQWTGAQVSAFEHEFAAACGCAHAVALANGTVALELALLALGIGAGDQIVCTPRSFVASAGSVALRGAIPVFADVDPLSQNLSAESIRAVLTPRTKGIVVVHLAGWPCDMEPIVALAGERGLKLIEDCAQAHGARYRGRPVGSFGDAAAWSFCQDKIISTGGEGGMLTTGDRQVWSRAWSYKDHGKNPQTALAAPAGRAFRWVHDGFGTNWRMTEFQAAIGRLQLRKLERWVQERRRNADLYAAQLGGLEALEIPRPGVGFDHAYYRFYAFVQPARLKPGWGRDRILEQINRAGVPCFQGSCSEIYLEKSFQDAGLAPPSRLPVAQRLGERSLCLQVHPGLREQQIRDCAEVVRQVILEAADT